MIIKTQQQSTLLRSSQYKKRPNYFLKTKLHFNQKSNASIGIKTNQITEVNLKVLLSLFIKNKIKFNL